MPEESALDIPIQELVRLFARVAAAVRLLFFRRHDNIISLQHELEMLTQIEILGPNHNSCLSWNGGFSG